MTKPTCSIDGCDKPTRARTWCTSHYKRWYHYGDPLAGAQTRTRSPRMPTCAEPDCDAPCLAREMCSKHYQRWYYYSKSQAYRVSPVVDGSRKCSKCGKRKPTSEFREGRGQCKDCVAARKRKWHEKNPRQPVGLAREPLVPCKNCGEPFRASGRQRHCSKLCATDYKSSRDRSNVLIRRARKRGQLVEEFQKREVFDRDLWLCGLCGEHIDSELSWPDPGSASLDHVVPISLGGEHSRANTQASHLFCNLSKHNRAA